jgi:light-regulated signal transduction histidine kinase (bacteriophytochrome)
MEEIHAGRREAGNWGLMDLSAVAKSIAAELREAEPGRHVEFVIENDLTAEGDSRLLRAALENLLRNSWKYTSAHPRARIEFGKTRQNGKSSFFVRDDGAGFDPRYSERLFGAFQRLQRVPWHRRRSCHCATHRPPAWRRDLGGRSGGAGRNVLLHIRTDST